MRLLPFALLIALTAGMGQAGITIDEDGAAEYLIRITAQVDGLTGALPLPPEPAPTGCDPSHTPATRGLFIGAAEWTSDDSYHLRGPVNDAELMRNAMIARGALTANLTVLAGADATRQGLTVAAAAMLATTGCGDSVLLHASGWVFGADLLAPTSDARGPFLFGEIDTTLADMAARDLGVNAFRPVVAEGPYLMLNQDTPQVSDVLNAAALSDLVTRLRNRGADVTVMLDTATAEEMRLEDRQAQVDGAAMWRQRLNPPGLSPAAPLRLTPQAGALTVYYGTGIGELTVEMNLPRGAPDARFYGVFSFRFASALLRADRTTPSALTRRITEDDNDGQIARQWAYVFSTTDPELDLIVETRPPALPGDGTIRILSPTPTRAAVALDQAALVLKGKVDATADTMIVTVNGKVAASTPDGSFEMPLELQAGVNRIDILAMTRDNQPITSSVELFYEGDMQALLGTGARYAVVIANQDYPDGSGLPDLATPIADAEALVAALARYGFQTTAKTPQGDANLFLRNATRLEIETVLYTLSQVAGDKDTVLIFYAGHGLYEAATEGAYWMPADAKMGLPFSYLPAAAITDALLRIKAGSVLVISDSCYSGALLRGTDTPEAIEGRPSACPATAGRQTLAHRHIIRGE